MFLSAYCRTVVVVWLVPDGMGAASVVLVVWWVVVVDVTAGSDEQAAKRATATAQRVRRRTEAFFIDKVTNGNLVSFVLDYGPHPSGGRLSQRKSAQPRVFRLRG